MDSNLSENARRFLQAMDSLKDQTESIKRGFLTAHTKVEIPAAPLKSAEQIMADATKVEIPAAALKSAEQITADAIEVMKKLSRPPESFGGSSPF